MRETVRKPEPDELPFHNLLSSFCLKCGTNVDFIDNISKQYQSACEYDIKTRVYTLLTGQRTTMFKSAYKIVKSGIEQEQTYHQVIRKLNDNMTFGVGYLGEYKSNQHGQIQSYFVLFSHALAALFKKVDCCGWGDIKEDNWRDEKITGNEKITVDYKNDVGWAITIGHSENGRNFTLQDVIGLENSWDIKWSTEWITTTLESS